MKNLLAHTTVIAALLVAVTGASGAVFSDSEMSTGNRFDAGTLDLKINGRDNPEQIVDFTDLLPGDYHTQNKTLSVDTSPARVWMHITDIVSGQGVQTEPEEVEENGIPKFDIENYLDYALTVNGATIIATDSAVKLPQYASCWIPLGVIPGATEVVSQQIFHFDPAVTNWAQGDSLTFTEEFLATQLDDPTIPDTGDGRIWDDSLKQCVDAPLSASLLFIPGPGEPYADAVTQVSGTFAHCCDAGDLSEDPAVAEEFATGASDSPPADSYIQVSDNAAVTLKFVDNKAVDRPGADIRIHTFDQVFPASALVEVSEDCVLFVTAGIYPDDADVDIDIGSVGLAEASCVRITDQEAVGDLFPALGFDLDAVEALHSVSVP